MDQTGDEIAYRVRTADDGDMPVVRDLYNALIPTTTVAWTEKPETLRERMTWYRAQQRAGHPVLVVETRAAGSSASRRTPASAATGSGRATDTPSSTRSTSTRTIGAGGSGACCSRRSWSTPASADIHVMVAAVDAANVESVVFHERLGFEVVARMSRGRPQVRPLARSRADAADPLNARSGRDGD